MKRREFIMLLGVAVVIALGSGVAAAEGYHLLQKVQVTPGDGIFDYAAARTA
jgi:hypothetical protein